MLSLFSPILSTIMVFYLCVLQTWTAGYSDSLKVIVCVELHSLLSQSGISKGKSPVTFR